MAIPNRESGDGRYDISMFPRDAKYPGIIMELKSEKDLNDKALESLTAEALQLYRSRNGEVSEDETWKCEAW